MLIILLGILTAIEITRLILSLVDSHRVKMLNQGAIKRAEVWEVEHRALRQAEIDDLKQMSRELGKAEQMLMEIMRDYGTKTKTS